MPPILSLPLEGLGLVANEVDLLSLLNFALAHSALHHACRHGFRVLRLAPPPPTQTCNRAGGSNPGCFCEIHGGESWDSVVLNVVTTLARPQAPRSILQSVTSIIITRSDSMANWLSHHLKYRDILLFLPSAALYLPLLRTIEFTLDHSLSRDFEWKQDLVSLKALGNQLVAVTLIVNKIWIMWTGTLMDYVEALVEVLSSLPKLKRLEVRLEGYHRPEESAEEAIRKLSEACDILGTDLSLVH